MKKKVETSKVILPGKSPHSQAIVSNGFVFTQGVICLTKDGEILKGSVEERVELIINNLKAILEEADSSLDNVVKVTIFVTDMSLYGEINEIYKEYFSEPYPARELVCVKELPLKAEIEISMIATK